MLNVDKIVLEFDHALRALTGAARTTRAMPDVADQGGLDAEERRHAAALLRVDHAGEVCAQALYQGQALASSNANIKAALATAALEEGDHLAWSALRIDELGGRTSLLNPLWYGGSLALGYLAGRAGDRWNLGFLAETERQVEEHLQGHLDRLSSKDVRTRAVIAAMQRDEAGHARTARELGAAELPAPVRHAMRAVAGVMTRVAYWV
jgi:ubiquinone biosynthesis monooxygenase Coq7